MTLEQIRQLAMIAVDQPNYETAGKWSKAWWTSLANKVQSLLAQQAGYYVKRYPVDIVANQQTSTLPSTLCYGILGVTLGNQSVIATGVPDLDEMYPGWRYQSDLPNQPGGDTLAVVSASASDTGEPTATVYGLDNTGAYATKTVELTGTTPVAVSLAGGLTWGEVSYVVLSEACVGAVALSRDADDAVICSIAIGDTTAGTAPTTATPRYYAIEGSSIVWYPMPDADASAWLRGGCTPTDLSGDSDVPQVLPAQFHYVLADGIAALAQGIDLSDQNLATRGNNYAQMWASGVNSLKAYINSQQFDREYSMGVDNSQYYGLYNQGRR